MKIKFVISVLLILAVTACAQKPDVPSMSVEKFISEMKSDSTLIILDVRTPQELVGPLGKIESAINIPIQELSNRINELDTYKENNIAVICRSGNRSVFGTKILLENGYNATNVLGGMKDYGNKKGK